MLLLVNFAVLIGILLKPSPTADAINLNPNAVIAEEASNSFEEQVAVAIESRPEGTPVTAPAPVAQTAEPSVNRANYVPPANSRTSIAVVPTIDELRLEGSLQIEELHLDIHVYSDLPADRFVFINMNKHREGSRTAEGPVVREIRTDGVVLEYQGRVFLLPRE